MRLVLALLIDADNISADFAPQIFSIAANLGEVITRRAFGNLAVFSGKEGWKEPVRTFAIEAFPQVSNVDRKNTADFAFIINAMDCLASGKYDGFVLASSDSDFTSLAQRLRDDNKLVYGIGDGRATISFRNACTQFFELTPPQTIPDGTEMNTETKPAHIPSEITTAQHSLKHDAIVNQDSSPAIPNSQKDVPPLASSKTPTEFQRIAADLQKRKCKKVVTLQNALMQTLKKTKEETEKIIKAMKSRGYISIDENNKITWLDK